MRKARKHENAPQVLADVCLVETHYARRVQLQESVQSTGVRTRSAHDPDRLAQNT